MGRTCNSVAAQIDGLVESSSLRISPSSSWNDPLQVHGVVFRRRPFVSQRRCNVLRVITFPLANFFALTLVKKPGSSPSPFNRHKKFVCFVRSYSPNLSWSPRSRFLFLPIRHRLGQTQSKSWSRTNNNAEYVGSPLLLSAFRFSFQFPAHKKSKKSGWNPARGLDFEDCIDLQLCKSKMKSRLIECVNSSRNRWNLRNQD